jgi:hypothetical protein
MEAYPVNVQGYSLEDIVSLSKEIMSAESKQNDNSNRDLLTRQIFQFIASWMIFVLLILVYTGKGDLKFSDTVIVTFISTTTANVLGFGIIVANYLFLNYAGLSHDFAGLYCNKIWNSRLC